MTADGKVCVNNAAKYGSHFLRFAIGSDERNAEYDALNHGDSSKLPEADPERHAYKLGVADKPATDAMEEGGQYQRLLVAIVVFVGELGAFCLLGALSVGVILAQVLLLLLLAFAPVALVAAAIPGRGHAFFKGWLEKLAGYLLRKAAYSLLLAILLAVNGALAERHRLARLADVLRPAGALLLGGLRAAQGAQREPDRDRHRPPRAGARGRAAGARALLRCPRRGPGRAEHRSRRPLGGRSARPGARGASTPAAPPRAPAPPAPPRASAPSYSRPVGRARAASRCAAPRAKPTERGRAGGERDKDGEKPGRQPNPWDELERVATPGRREQSARPAGPERPRGPRSRRHPGEGSARRTRPAPPDPSEAQPKKENRDGDSLDAELRAERERRRPSPRKPNARKPTDDGGPRTPRRFSRLRRGRRKGRGR